MGGKYQWVFPKNILSSSLVDIIFFRTFNGVYSRNNLSKIKDGEYLINLDEYESIRNHWIALQVNIKNVTYFGRFEVEILQKRLRNSLVIKMLQQIFIEHKHVL